MSAETTPAPLPEHELVDKSDFALVISYVDGGFHLVEQYRYAVKGRYST